MARAQTTRGPARLDDACDAATDAAELDAVLQHLGAKGPLFVADHERGALVAAQIDDRRVLTVLGALRSCGWSMVSSDAVQCASADANSQGLVRTWYLEKEFAPRHSDRPATKPAAFRPPPMPAGPPLMPKPAPMPKSMPMTAPVTPPEAPHHAVAAAPDDRAGREQAFFEQKRLEAAAANAAARAKLADMDADARAALDAAQLQDEEHARLKARHTRNLAANYRAPTVRNAGAVGEEGRGAAGCGGRGAAGRAAVGSAAI
ncbi:hypothetical protein M885DRAFT_561119 [Pelagophyceae sp. CCMP2097]|nr:hypothetical protein M885DRAFT_561119 [Pelagophyceae sp. CCMP2097]